MIDHQSKQLSSNVFRVGLAIGWLVLFLVVFYSFTLPNSNPRTSRGDVWQAVPVLYLELIDPTVEDGAPKSGWSQLPSRFTPLLIALGIHLAAWSLGGLLLRLLRWDHQGDGLERTVFASALGLSGLSLMTLAFGLAGWLHRELFLVILIAVVIAEQSYRFRSRRHNFPGPQKSSSHSRTNQPEKIHDTRLRTVCLCLVTPFLLAMLLGSLLPSFDFDVKAYHLQGPKEFFQNGRIEFLPHNVYTSFPFLTEMLSLLAMVLQDDWYNGALAGKAVLMGFAPLTAVALFVAGRRLFGEAAGWLAAIIHLTTPWIYRISIIAYAEGGLTFFLFVSLLAIIRGAEKYRESQSPKSYLLAGLLAGSAMACKYPGVLQVVIPLGIAAGFVPFQFAKVKAERWQAALKCCGVFGLGVLLTMGPWLMKNLIETGNPVYPLVYSVFGGTDWNNAANEKWRDGHSPDDHRLADLGVKFVDVTLKSDWLSPLLFGFAPLVLLNSNMRKRTRWLWLYLGFLFLAWWTFTHRIDRFWVPMLPVVSLLAGAGACWSKSRNWRTGCGVVIATSAIFNLAFITTGLCGYNAYLIDLQAARKQAETTSAGIPFLNRQLPANSVVLCVGEAQVFDARCKVIYNTVFDASIFEDWFAAEATSGDEPRALRPVKEIREKLTAQGVTHIYVNWQEVSRYRNTYGFTKFVTPRRFFELQETGVLGESLTADADRKSKHSPRFEVFPVLAE
jgi:hypothetical protein